jgi:hypothetical protein
MATFGVPLGKKGADSNHRGLNNGGRKLIQFVDSLSLFRITCLIGEILLTSLKATFITSFVGTRSSVTNLTISLVP